MICNHLFDQMTGIENRINSSSPWGRILTIYAISVQSHDIKYKHLLIFPQKYSAHQVIKTAVPFAIVYYTVFLLATCHQILRMWFILTGHKFCSHVMGHFLPSIMVNSSCLYHAMRPDQQISLQHLIKFFNHHIYSIFKKIPGIYLQPF